MRFPKLYNFFRRSKSDTALASRRHRKSSDSANELTRKRPVSSSFLDKITTPESSELSSVLASVAVEPVSFVQPPIGTTAPPAAPDLPMPPFISCLECAALKDRLTELDCLMKSQVEEGDRIVASLDEKLKIERTAAAELREANLLLTAESTKVQAEIMRTRGELHTALNYQLRFSTGAESERNRNLLEENDRLRRFTKLLISCSAYNGVLERTSQRVEQGYDPEDSVVDAIKVSLEDPESVWHRLLDPLLGERSPQDYLAQTKCTLKARRESRDWEKKAKFWRETAKEEGRHMNTITPSVSQLSDVFPEVPPERKVALDDMLHKLRHGSLPLTVESRQNSTNPVLIPIAQAMVQAASSSPQVPSNPVPQPEAEEVQISQPSQVCLTTIVESASESDSEDVMALDTSNSSGAISSSREVNPTRPRSCPSSCALHLDDPPSEIENPPTSLAPLASVAFRESHSIKSVSSRRKRSHRLTPSSTMSSQESHISRLSDRKAKVLAASRSVSLNLLDALYAAHLASEPSSGLSGSTEDLARVVSNALASSSLFRDEEPRDIHITDSPLPMSPPIESGKKPLVHSGPDPSHSLPIYVPANPTNITTPPRKLVAPSSSYHPPAHQFNNATSPLTSPESGKKSKLPVLKFASVPRSIRRLSISRPVLVDTTNAAAVPPTKSIRVVTLGKGKNDEGGGKSRLMVMSPKTKSRMRIQTAFTGIGRVVQT
ncbi:hypothetical protein BXZ70DRAFT_943873 [Cristinia sonorae]|uniref:Uncharacterized protein n=1 Tax=Cristinia sonorae TaxID=1940300 RepID=A0A8K0UM18_9AGAR|nr:hypothetical protein BXZ70DRAFT_943873 [Cristinia sonorae]